MCVSTGRPRRRRSCGLRARRRPSEAARRPSGFRSLRELTRIVGHDCAIEVDANSYSVPWQLIGERVAVTVAGGGAHPARGAEVAAHLQAEGRRLRIVDRVHLAGVTAASRPAGLEAPAVPSAAALAAASARRLRGCDRGRF